MFSAFQSSTESSIINSRDNSPDPAGANKLSPEKDVDDELNVSMISLTGNNKDFQRLVDEAKAEKERIKRGPQVSLAIDTSSFIESEKSASRRNTVNQSQELFGDLPKPLPKP